MSIYAIQLDQQSQDLLLQNFEKPDSDWETKADHVTIALNEIPEDFEPYLDTDMTITVKTLGYNERVMAVGVQIHHSIVDSKNKIPHITLFINKSLGAKPKESNDIENWQELDQTFKITGTFTKM